MPDPFTCPFCGAVSHNPRDAEERYCGRCHVFVDDERQKYEAIINRAQEHDPTSYKAGRDAHARGEPFGRPDVNHFTVEALSWRMGWNDRALEQHDG